MHTTLWLRKCPCPGLTLVLVLVHTALHAPMNFAEAQAARFNSKMSGQLLGSAYVWWVLVDSPLLLHGVNAGWVRMM